MLLRALRFAGIFWPMMSMSYRIWIENDYGWDTPLMASCHDDLGRHFHDSKWKSFKQAIKISCDQNWWRIIIISSYRHKINTSLIHFDECDTYANV